MPGELNGDIPQQEVATTPTQDNLITQTDEEQQHVVVQKTVDTTPVVTSEEVPVETLITTTNGDNEQNVEVAIEENGNHQHHETLEVEEIHQKVEAEVPEADEGIEVAVEPTQSHSIVEEELLVCERPNTSTPEVIEVCQKPVHEEEPEQQPLEEEPSHKEEENQHIETEVAVENEVVQQEVVSPVPEIVVNDEASSKAATGSYSQVIENDKNKKIEKEYTREVIESEVPARIVEEVKKGLFENSGNGVRNAEQVGHGDLPKKSSMSTCVDNTVKSAYEDVRNDNSETQWAVFKFDGPNIKCSATGTTFDVFQQQFGDKERAFGYIRVQTGDEMSKRQKFLFVTWVGPAVSVLQRAKMSTDKAFIKNTISNFAVELQLENQSELDLNNFVNELNKAGGANYGTGVRSN